MRWFWIDRFTEFVAGKRASAVKSVSLSEEAVDEYAAGRTFLPASVIIEGLAQTGGLLVSQMTGFKGRIVLAKVQSSKFYFEVYPGHLLEYQIELTDKDDVSAFVSGTSHVDGKLQGEFNLMFAILTDKRFAEVELFDPDELCRMCRILRMFEVGVNEDGSSIEVPAHFLEAEKNVMLRGIES